MTERVDVLVVGGGPAGLATAHAVAAYGYTVLLVHRDQSIGYPVRTSGGSWERSLHGLGLPPHLYHALDSITFAGPTKQARIRFGADRPVILDVTQTYRYLAALAEQAGVTVACGTSFDQVLEMTPDEVVCRLSHSGISRQVTARFVVDASGHWRAVLSSLGVAQRPQRFGVGVEYEFKNEGGDTTDAVLFVGNEFAPSGYGWIFPTRSGTVRVGVGIIRPDVKVAPTKLLEGFLQSEAAAQLGLKLGALVERHFGVIPSDGQADTFVHGRCIAVGDAAGQALPLVGEGIRYGIEAGRRAGTAISQALREPGRTTHHLSQYSRWWDRTYRRTFAFAQAANLRVSTYSEAQWDEKVALIALMDGDVMAEFLRMEFSMVRAFRLLRRQPMMALYRRLRRLWSPRSSKPGVVAAKA